MKRVTVLLQGVGAGKDPEVIPTAAGCSPSPFSSLIHQAGIFGAPADPHPGCIWRAELMLPSQSFAHISFVMGSCFVPVWPLSTPSYPHAWVAWIYLKRKRDSPRRHWSRSPTWQQCTLEPCCLRSACYLGWTPKGCGNQWANSFAPICTGVRATSKAIGIIHWATTCSCHTRCLKSTVDTQQPSHLWSWTATPLIQSNRTLHTQAGSSLSLQEILFARTLIQCQALYSKPDQNSIYLDLLVGT